MERRRKVAISFIIGMVLLAIIVNIYVGDPSPYGSLSYLEEEIVQPGSEDKIAQIWIDGTIEDDTGYNGSFGFAHIMDQLEQVKNDSTVKGVVIRIDSPGGAVVATDELYNKIQEIKQEKKVVVASLGSIAASGGYYLAASADRIYANPATLTGSLGVIFSFYNFTNLADKYGVEEIVIKSGDYKDIGNPLRKMTETERAIFQELVDESYQRFVDIIVEGRNIPREEVLKLADGRIYSGNQAKNAGLIDEFGSLEMATEGAKELANVPDATVIRYIQPFTMGSLFQEFFGMNIQPFHLTKLDEILEKKGMPKLQYLFKP